MAVVNIHTGVATSPKHAPLSDPAFRLWTHALLWSKEHLTDGFIPAGMLATLHPRGPRVVAELLRVLVPGKGPLWHEVEGGYQIHDYQDWQDTKARVQERRQQWRTRQDRKRSTTSVRGVTRDTTRDVRVSHANRPSDGSGGGRGIGRGTGDPPTDPTFETPTVAGPAVSGGGGHAPTERRVPGTRVSPPDEHQPAAEGRSTDEKERAERWLEKFTAAHLALRGSRFIVKRDRDLEPALRLVRTYDDRELDTLTHWFLKATGPDYDDKPRTPGRLAYVQTTLQEYLVAHGVWTGDEAPASGRQQPSDAVRAANWPAQPKGVGASVLAANDALLERLRQRELAAAGADEALSQQTAAPGLQPAAHFPGTPRGVGASVLAANDALLERTRQRELAAAGGDAPRSRQPAAQRLNGVPSIPSPATWAAQWRCHHAEAPCGSRTACELRTARDVGEGRVPLESVPPVIRRAVEAMAPAYTPTKAASA